jgi:hypothetical protein
VSKRQRPPANARRSVPKGQAPKRRVRRKWVGGGVATTVIGGVILAIVLSAGHKVATALVGSPQPLTVTARLFPPGDSCDGGSGWVFLESKSQLPVPSWQAGAASLQRWASAHGGIPASGNFVVADLQAVPGHTVIINDVRIQVVQRASVPVGVYPALSGGCGGIVPTSFRANLDRSSIVLTMTTVGSGFGKPAAPIPLPHEVSESGPEVWYIMATTQACDCEWKAYLDWSSDGKTGSTPIDENGRPFRTLATTRATKVTRNGSGRAWYTY